MKKYTLVAAAVALVCGTAVQAEEFSFAEAMKNGTAKISFRARYEGVDQDNIDKSGTAITNRTRLTFDSAKFGNWSFSIEMDDVHALVDDYNSTTNGNTDRPVVADPEGTDLNQAKLVYSNNGFTTVLGRQRVNVGSQRLVGGVGWRQNEQTYDAAAFVYKFNDAFSSTYAYIDNVNRIFGPVDGAQLADVRGDHHLLTADYKLNADHKFAFTGLLIDPSNNALAGVGTTTAAIDYTGKAGDFSWALGFATQSDDGENPTDYSADYSLFELGYKAGVVNLTVGQETLGSDNGVRAFQTPLATGHKFQGFADKFLVTPANGVVDTYFKVAGKAGPVALSAIFHQFDADFGGGSYGDELNLVANYKMNDNYSLLFKYAAYSGDSAAAGAFAVDVDKVWFMFSANY